MNLIAVNLDSLPLGRPLPFNLRAADGGLLAPRGYVIRNRAEVEILLSRGVTLHMDTDESSDSHRSYVGQLEQMLREETPLGQIARMKMDVEAPTRSDVLADGPPDWGELQHYTAQLLRHPRGPEVAPRLQALAATLQRHIVQTPDASLLALIWLSSQDTRRYSALHALLVAALCMLTAQETLQWPADTTQTLGCAALSMNISMTALQDALAQQAEALNAQQIRTVYDHAEQSEALLHDLGVTDALWLQAVRAHHHRTSGSLAEQPLAQQMARLIQRADLFAARMAPRAARHAMNATAATKAIYYDDKGQVDEAGAALVRTLGMYPPGSLVRLVSQEVALVLRRGASATTPRVAVIVGRSGMPTGEPIPRDTRQSNYKISAALAAHEVRQQLPLPRLVAMV